MVLAKSQKNWQRDPIPIHNLAGWQICILQGPLSPLPRIGGLEISKILLTSQA
jgi:hypothetical protein